MPLNCGIGQDSFCVCVWLNYFTFFFFFFCSEFCHTLEWNSHGTRLLRVSWTARRSNQSILEEISPGCSIEGLRLKLKLQYFGCLMWRVDSLEKILMLGGIGGRRKGTTEDEMDGINDSMDLSLSKLWEFVIHKEAWNAVIHGVTNSWTQLSDWT